MYKFIQRNQKKMLAVFGVLLMIVFIIPTTQKNSFSRGGEVTIGKMGKTPLYASDEAEAKSDLQVLASLYPPINELGGGIPTKQGQIGVAYLAFHEHPLLYSMLVKEAQRRGLQVTDAFVEQSMTAGLQQIEDMWRRQEMQAPPVSAEQQENLRKALSRYLLVKALYDQAASSLRVSQPLAQHLLVAPEQEVPVGGFQQVQLNVVELSAAQFQNSVPEPTPEQVRQQYEKYADVFPHQQPRMPTTAPAPVYGYRVPDRFKVQYVELPTDRVVDAFLKTLSRDDLFNLDLVANNYYADPRHTDEFLNVPETQSTSAPASAPSATATATAAATSKPAGPTTKPFAEALPDLRRKILTGETRLDPEAPASMNAIYKELDDRLAKFKRDLTRDLHDRIDSEYRQYAKSGGSSATTAPAEPTTTAPSANSPVTHDQFAFLDQVADAFEKAHGVRPLSHAFGNDWKSEDDLKSLPGVGTAKTATGTAFTQLIEQRAAAHRPPAPPATQPTSGPATQGGAIASSSTTVPSDVAATTRPAGAESAAWVSLLEPSPVLEDTRHNAYIFRVTAFDPEHKPRLEEIEPAIVKDLKSAAAYERAQAEAKKLTDAATAINALPNAPEIGALPQVAQASGYHPITTGPVAGLAPMAVLGKNPMVAQQLFQQMMRMQIPGYNLDFMAKFRFIPEVAPLVLRLSPTDRHPTMTVNLPGDKVVAVEIADVEFPWTAEQARREELQAAVMFREAMESPFAREWFDFDNTAARLNYTSTDRGDGKPKKS